MAQFGPSIEHQVPGSPRPSIEPITFPCRADALLVMSRTQLGEYYVTNLFLYPHINLFDCRLYLCLTTGFAQLVLNVNKDHNITSEA